MRLFVNAVHPNRVTPVWLGVQYPSIQIEYTDRHTVVKGRGSKRLDDHEIEDQQDDDPFVDMRRGDDRIVQPGAQFVGDHFARQCVL